MGFLVSEVALGRVFHRALRFPLLIAILQMLHTRLSSGARTLCLLEAAVGYQGTEPHSTATSLMKQQFVVTRRYIILQ
jgi:hypothetical protein